jgi:4-hydroxybenzoate polyprenyltransferase
MPISFKSLLKYYRAKDWRAYFALGLFGFFISRGFLFSPLDILLFFTIGILLLAFGFSINNFFDIKEDREKFAELHSSHTLRFTWAEEVKNLLIQNKRNFFFSFSPGILALFLSAYFGKEVFLFILIAGLIGFFYSAPPLRMKSRPFLDLVSHGLFAGALIFLFPVLVFAPQLTSFHYLIALSVFYLSATIEMRNHLEDYQSDLRASLKTTVCFLGFKNSEILLKYLCLFYSLILLPIFFIIFQEYDFLALLFLILTAVFLFLFLFKRNYQIVGAYAYRIMDGYAVLSYVIILLAALYHGQW